MATVACYLVGKKKPEGNKKEQYAITANLDWRVVETLISWFPGTLESF